VVLVLLVRLMRAGRVRAWGLPAVVIGVVFVTSWPLMALTEGRDAPVVEPANYWWWFLITSSTVGYGDYYPTTSAGHVVGAYVVIGGIATLTTLFTRIAGFLDAARGRRMRGAVTVSSSGHTLILGYTAGRTEQIVEEVLAEGGRSVVLATGEDVAEHPMPERAVEFVRGDLLSESVLRRAGVHRSASVLIDAKDDNEAMAIALSVSHAAPNAHTVVALRDMNRSTQVAYINAAAHTVPWHSPRVIAEELQSPGIARVYAELMTHGGENTYAMSLPDLMADTSFGDVQTALGHEFQATALAADTGTELLVSPSWDTVLRSGTVIYYVCRQQVPPDRFTRAVGRWRGRHSPEEGRAQG
jgi:voltage-gated potassium channel